MKYIKKYWLILIAVLILIVAMQLLNFFSIKNKTNNSTAVKKVDTTNNPANDSVINYGRQLMDSTSKYLGPNGTIAAITNGLNCGNCHLEGGRKLYTNNFFAVAHTYPKFRERSGKVESVEWRVNECLQRSLNGQEIDSLSNEMKAMVAYIKWTGNNLSKDVPADEIKTKELPFLERAAEPVKGKIIYSARCKVCHGENGQGLLAAGSVKYVYPPLWGDHSYAVSAGMYRITKLASFIKYNMPLGAEFKKPLVADSEAWDVAAFINTQPHPHKIFKTDWPKISSKPVDFPYGPYADNFSEKQHKYGPFEEIQKAKTK